MLKLAALQENTRWYHALLSALLFAPFLLATLLWWGPQFEQLYGVTVLDLALGLDGAEVQAYLERYGETGRRQYLLFFVFDFFLPLFGAITTASWWTVLLKQLFPTRPHYWLPALWLGLLPMLADWCENLGFLLQWLLFPATVTTIGALTLLMSKIKLTALIISQSGFVVVLAVFLWLKLLRKL